MRLYCTRLIFSLLTALMLTISTTNKHQPLVSAARLHNIPPPWELLMTPKPAPVADTKVVINERKFYPSDPLARDLNPRLLRKMLGKEHDPKRSAITRTEFLAQKLNGSRDNLDVRRMLTQSMPAEIKNLDFKMPGMGRYLGPKASRKLQLWLWKVSYCPMLQKWRDLGVRFSPRYINVGRCSKKSTCSFPKGMRCEVSETKKVGVLRWHCLDKFKKRSNTSCVWRKFAYPVITKCRCSCRR